MNTEVTDESESNNRVLFKAGKKKIQNSESILRLMNGNEKKIDSGVRARENSINIKLEENRNHISQIPRGENFRINSKSLDNSSGKLEKSVGPTEKVKILEQVNSTSVPNGFNDSHFTSPNNSTLAIHKPYFGKFFIIKQSPRLTKEIPENEEYLVDNTGPNSKEELEHTIDSQRKKIQMPQKFENEIDNSLICNKEFLRKQRSQNDLKPNYKDFTLQRKGVGLKQMLEAGGYVSGNSAIKLDSSKQINFNQRSVALLPDERFKQADGVKDQIRRNKMYYDVGENIPFTRKLEKAEISQKRYE